MSVKNKHWERVIDYWQRTYYEHRAKQAQLYGQYEKHIKNISSYYDLFVFSRL